MVKPASPDVLPLDTCTVRVVDAARVEAAKRELPPEDELDGITRLFKLLGDATRAKLLYALLEAGELCVCDLAATADASETTVSQALRLLRAAGVVRTRRAGRQINYRLDDAHVRMLLDVTREHLRHSVSEQP